jgi:hypothetical protein
VRAGQKWRLPRPALRYTLSRPGRKSHGYRNWSSLAFSPLLENHPARALPIRVLALDSQVVLLASKVLYLAGPAKCGGNMATMATFATTTKSVN